MGAQGRVRVQPFPDGTYFGGPEVRDDSDVVAQIRQFSKRDAERYADWIFFWREAAALFRPYVLSEPPTLEELVRSNRGSGRGKILETLINRSHFDLVEEYFEDEHTKAFVTEPGSHESDPSSAGSPLCSAIWRHSLGHPG